MRNKQTATRSQAFSACQLRSFGRVWSAKDIPSRLASHRAQCPALRRRKAGLPISHEQHHPYGTQRERAIANCCGTACGEVAALLHFAPRVHGAREGFAAKLVSSGLAPVRLLGPSEVLPIALGRWDASPARTKAS